VGLPAGAAHIAAGFAVLLSIWPRLAAMLEAAMLSAFTILVWIPAVVTTTATRASWSESAISWAMSAGAWVVAAPIGKSPARKSA
jgi:hypothetical protein